jgi:hypothetical protein
LIHLHTRVASRLPELEVFDHVRARGAAAAHADNGRMVNAHDRRQRSHPRCAGALYLHAWRAAGIPTAVISNPDEAEFLPAPSSAGTRKEN